MELVKTRLVLQLVNFLKVCGKEVTSCHFMSMDTDNSQIVSNDQGVWRWWLLYFVQRIWWLELEHSWIWLLSSSNDAEMFVSVEWVVTWDYNEYWLQLPPHAKSAYHFLSSGRLIGFFFKAWATSHSSYVDTQSCFLNAPYSWTYEQRKQYKFSCCVLCREVVLFSEVQNVLKLAIGKPIIQDLEKCPL